MSLAVKDPRDAFESDDDIVDWFREATGAEVAKQKPIPALIERVRHPKAGRNALRTVVLVIVANIGVQLSLIATAREHHWSSGDSLRTSLFAAAAFFIIISGVVAIRAGDLGIQPVWLHGRAVNAVAIGGAVGGAAAILLTAASSLALDHPFVDPLAGAVANTGLLVLVGGFAVLAMAAPLAEEFVFRGFFAEALRIRGRRGAVLLSAIAFSIAHLRFAQFQYYVFVGIVLGVLYWGRGLVASVSAHAAFNGLLVVFAIASVHAPAQAYTVGTVGIELPGRWHRTAAHAPTDFVALGPGTAQIAVSHVNIPSGVNIDVQRLAGVLASGAVPLPNDMHIDTGSVTLRQDLAIGPGVAARSTVQGHTDDAVFVITGQQLVIFEIVANGSDQATRDFDRMVRQAHSAG